MIWKGLERTMFYAENKKKMAALSKILEPQFNVKSVSPKIKLYIAHSQDFSHILHAILWVFFFAVHTLVGTWFVL